MFASCLCVFACGGLSPAIAQTASPQPAPVSELTVESVPPECRVLPDHKPSHDVEYRPGVDVHGKAVVPADINAPLSGLAGRPVVVPLTVDLAQRLQGVSRPDIGMEGTLGFLEIYPDGRVTYDGQDLTSQVHVLCGKKPPESGSSAAVEPDRQIGPDIIESAPVKEIKPAPSGAATAPAQSATPAKKAEPYGEIIKGGAYKD